MPKLLTTSQTSVLAVRLTFRRHWHLYNEPMSLITYLAFQCWLATLEPNRGSAKQK